jgi:hypothetical protein
VSGVAQRVIHFAGLFRIANIYTREQSEVFLAVSSKRRSKEEAFPYSGLCQQPSGAISSSAAAGPQLPRL